MAPPEQSWCCPKPLQSIPNSQLRVVLTITPGPNDSSCVSFPKSSPARLVGSELQHSAEIACTSQPVRIGHSRAARETLDGMTLGPQLLAGPERGRCGFRPRGMSD